MGGQTAINLGAYSGMMESFRGISKTPVLYNIPCVFLSASESLFLCPNEPLTLGGSHQKKESVRKMSLCCNSFFFCVCVNETCN